VIVIYFLPFNRFSSSFIKELWRKHGTNVSNNAIVAMYVIAAVSSTVSAELVRRDLKNLNREQVKDEGWGYGQTTAILIWVLFFGAVIKESFGKS